MAAIELVSREIPFRVDETIRLDTFQSVGISAKAHRHNRAPSPHHRLPKDLPSAVERIMETVARGIRTLIAWSRQPARALR
jgi:hypothetical protein